MSAAEPAGRSRRRAWVWRVGFLVLLVVGFGARLVALIMHSRHDHDGWLAVVVGLGGGLVVVALVVWGSVAGWRRQVAGLRRAHPTAAVVAVNTARWSYLLYVDTEVIELINHFGKVKRSWRRDDISSARMTSIQFPMGTRSGLVVTFRDGDRLQVRSNTLRDDKAALERVLAYLGQDPT